MSKVYFSLQEAESVINKIKRKIDRVARLREEILVLDNTKIFFDSANMENLLLEVQLSKNFHEKNLEMFSLITEIVQEGCIIRNIDDFEIDFYYKLKDKDIFLCWKNGEERISFWHELTETAKQRKPIKQIQQNYYEQLKQLR